MKSKVSMNIKETAGLHFVIPNSVPDSARYLTDRFNTNKLFCFVFACFFFSLTAKAQQKEFTLSNAHAHNDYIHPVPFYTAYKAGFGSIEVDIFSVNGILCVAHSQSEIQTQRTLKSLYLDVLLNELRADSSLRLKLLVDIKENYEVSLHLLIKEIEPLKQYLSAHGKRGSLTILISGSRPPPSEYKNYPEYIFFDDNLTLQHTAEEWKRVGQVSLSFQKFSAWKGKGLLQQEDKNRLKYTIDSVHQAGKTIRFWAAPDNEASWLMQIECGVDLIGTDNIDGLAEFLRSRVKKK